MLKKCPECELPVSDKAYSCPHCGYPLKSSQRQSPNRKKRMRLPNGFGQISEIKGRPLRKPFRAMITVDRNIAGHCISKTLGYYETYNDAYEALVEYHKSPYDVINKGATCDDVYKAWSSEYFKTLKSSGSIQSYRSLWNKCENIHKLPIDRCRVRELKKTIELVESPNLKARMKTMFNLMYDYALEYDLVEKNYARAFSLPKDVVKAKNQNIKDHIAFTDEEIQILWENIKVPYVDLILIQCYSGWRPNELLNITIDGDFMCGGSKTDSGRNRRVPIHHKIKPLIEKRKEIGNITYTSYNRNFHKVMRALGLNDKHRPHDPRKHFITQCKKYNVDEYAIKYMVGHSINDVTERVYTEREDSWLKEEIEKIP